MSSSKSSDVATSFIAGVVVVAVVIAHAVIILIVMGVVVGGDSGFVAGSGGGGGSGIAGGVGNLAFQPLQVAREWLPLFPETTNEFLEDGRLIGRTKRREDLDFIEQIQRKTG